MEPQVRDSPFFYVGLYDDEQRAERLANIKAINREQIGEAWFPGGIEYQTDYIIRESKSHHSWAILIERPDGEPETFVTEVRNPWTADAFRKLCDTYGDVAVASIKKWERIYCKEKVAFANYYSQEHSNIVNAAYTGIKRELENAVRVQTPPHRRNIPQKHATGIRRPAVEFFGAVDVDASDMVYDALHQPVGQQGQRRRAGTR